MTHKTCRIKKLEEGGSVHKTMVIQGPPCPALNAVATVLVVPALEDKSRLNEARAFLLASILIFYQDTEPPARMTVYPREKEPQDEVPMFFVADYHETLLRIGFNTRIEGERYLDYIQTWRRDTWQIGVPVSFANRLIFIRSEAAHSASLPFPFYRHEQKAKAAADGRNDLRNPSAKHVHHTITSDAGSSSHTHVLATALRLHPLKNGQLLDDFGDHFDEIGKLLLDREADIDTELPCACGSGANRTTKCFDCISYPAACPDCFIRSHIHHPIHWAEVWDPLAQFFIRNDISRLGHTIQLGHNGDTCKDALRRAYSPLLMGTVSIRQS
ncbi:hypothetical protein B0H14DRAFT_2561953 [Mycena olivaceomarginata]|nr:hypothetical protein B0H14DRAFT_2561953 [Mycena olivaceomarginata]